MREEGCLALTDPVQCLGRPVAEVQLCDLSKARDLTAFLHLVPYRSQCQLHVVSHANAVCFTNCLAEDEIVIELPF